MALTQAKLQYKREHKHLISNRRFGFRHVGTLIYAGPPGIIDIQRIPDFLQERPVSLWQQFKNVFGKKA